MRAAQFLPAYVSPRLSATSQETWHEPSADCLQDRGVARLFRCL